MPAKYFDIDLDIKDPKIRMIPYIEVVSGDTDTNVFNIQLFENFVPVNASGYTAVISFGKPDGTSVYQNLTVVDATLGKYTCTLSSQTIAAAGIVRAEVSLYEGTKRLTSNRFEFRVRKPILDDDTIESSNEFSALQDALAEVEELKQTGLKGDPGDPGPPGPPGEKGEPGDVGINWRGNFDSETNYDVNDGVYYEGSSYRALQPTQGNFPTPLGNEYWFPLALKGVDGADGVESPYNIVYVAKHGDDSNPGTLAQPKLTISAAIATAAGRIDANNPQAVVVVLDAGRYTETITMQDNVHLLAEKATVVGRINIRNHCKVKLYAHYASESSQTMLYKDGTAHAYYETVVSDGRGLAGNLTAVSNIYNITSSSILFVKVELMIVATNGIGVREYSSTTGHIHFNIRDLYLAGNGARGVYAQGQASNIIGKLDHILKMGTPTNTTAIQVSNPDCILRIEAGEILADTAYNIVNGELYLNCPRIVGTATGTPVFTPASQQALASHLEENMTDSDGVHGLKIEEGSWTPVIEGSTVAGTNTYSLQVGEYYKVGKKVRITFSIVVTAKDPSMSGGIRIGGIPFNIAGPNLANGGMLSYVKGWTATSNGTVLSLTGDAATKINLMKNNVAGGNSEYVGVSEFGTGFTLSGTIDYITN